MSAWNKLDKSIKPDSKTIRSFVDNPLWDDLCKYLEEQYQTKPVIEYSGCSVPGWNVKYRKSGRSLCTIYPMKGYFIALVVISEKEKTETEFALPTLTEYVRQVYQETKEGMGQRWLMITVRDTSVLADVKTLIGIRRKIKTAAPAVKFSSKSNSNIFEKT